MVTSHVDDVASDVAANMVTMAPFTSSLVEKCLEESRGHTHSQVTSDDDLERQEGGNVDQQEMFSVKLLPSSTTTNDADVLMNKSNNSPAMAEQVPLEEESPTPILQQDAPLCSTPDKMECGSLDTKHMSRSPSIPLQNTSVKMAKVDNTPTVLPQRMIALEGLYNDESTDSDHDHDSLDLFDDSVIPTSQSKDDQNLAVASPALFVDQQIPPDHVDTTPSLSCSALADSISTQVSILGFVCMCVCQCVTCVYVYVCVTHMSVVYTWIRAFM